MISEMLLRRTRAGNVVSVYGSFLEKFPDIESLARSSDADVENTISSLGMIGRARHLVSVAKRIEGRGAGQFPQSKNELLELIGPSSHYTVNAIRCFAFNQREPIFDVNVKRIIERVFSLNLGPDAHKKKISWDLTSLLLPDANVREFNWALLDLGKSICTFHNPKCEICPLRIICDYARHILPA